MLGCHHCLEDIALVKTSCGRLWLDLVKCAIDEFDLIILQKPNREDFANLNWLDSNGYIKTSEHDRPDEILIYIVNVEGVACKNRNHAQIPHDLDLN